MIGEVLGNRYKLLRELGAGGMAWVYLAKDLAEDTRVAIKILYPQFNHDMSYVERFQREAKLAHQISSDHIVRILDYGADRDLYYLVMEQIQGKDLRTVLDDLGKLPWQEAFRIGKQVVQALKAANEQGIVHRDIKPQNIMIDSHGLVKVLDFGIARAETLPALTQGRMVGSPNYVSPEQATSKTIDIRSDIYSLGVVLYEAISGSLPFDADTAWSVIKQHVDQEPPSLSLENGALPPKVQAVVNKMLAKAPNDRYQTPDVLLEAIESLLDESAGQQPTDTYDPAHQLLLSGLYTRALDAISCQEWPRAVNLIRQVLNIDPEYKDAQDRLAYAEMQDRLASLYGAAREAMEKTRWQEAVDALSEIVGTEIEYRDAAELLTRAGMALSELKTQEHLAHLYHNGLSYYQNEEWSKAQSHLEQVLEADPDYLDAAALSVKARRRARWSHSPLGRISRNLTHWLHGPPELDPPDFEVEELSPADRLGPTDSELRNDYGEPTAFGE